MDTPEDGQACIGYLREHNIGRANFVVLTQAGQHKAAMERSQVFTFPEGSKRLFDLITPTNVALMPAFYMALKDTLVAKDLDAAVAMAYQGGKPMRRVVTLEGNLIDNSGSMSGGGKSVKSGGMRLSGTAAPRTATVAADEVRLQYLILCYDIFRSIRPQLFLHAVTRYILYTVRQISDYYSTNNNRTGDESVAI